PGVVPPVAGTLLTVVFRPKPCRVPCATWSDCPISFGTLMPPPETTSVTEEPGLTDVPASGFCLITVPWGWVEFGLVRTCGLRPLPLMVFCAWLTFCPTTLGTATSFGPLDTYKVTTVPAGSWLPNGGLLLMTCPEATVPLVCLTDTGLRCACLTLA